MSALEVGRIYERDGLQRRVQAVRPPSRREPNGAVEWHRPGGRLVVQNDITAAVEPMASEGGGLARIDGVEAVTKEGVISFCSRPVVLLIGFSLLLVVVWVVGRRRSTRRQRLLREMPLNDLSHVHYNPKLHRTPRRRG